MGNNMVGFEIGSKLNEAGLIPDNVRRIIIDIPCDGLIVIYYECLGDKKQIDLVLEELIKNKDKLKIIQVDKDVDKCPEDV